MTDLKNSIGLLSTEKRHCSGLFEKLNITARNIRSETGELKGKYSNEYEQVNSIVKQITGENISQYSAKLKEKLLRNGAHLIVKLAPMLDISEGIRQLPETFRIDVLSWKGECRELLFHIKKGGSSPQIHCHE